jgi:hypothetical protein
MAPIIPLFCAFEKLKECLAERGLFTNVRHERHETRPLDRVLYGTLKGSAVATALAAEELALTGAKLLEALHVLVIHERWPRTSFLGAKTAAVLPAAP